MKKKNQIPMKKLKKKKRKEKNLKKNMVIDSF